MAKETTYRGIVGDWQRMLGAMEDNLEEVPQLQPFYDKLLPMVAQALEITKRQAALTASKQEMSKQIRELITEGQRLATVVRTVVREHYGIREEKLAAFGMQPFRGRKPKKEEEPLESSEKTA
ncbi:MAG TPA: hypothetical protein VHN15_13430 [Thermoanaerobaculia bacterium]|nr:hypothetical protein [Thermoanaerobaculia bacterium]